MSFSAIPAERALKTCLVSFTTNEMMFTFDQEND